MAIEHLFGRVGRTIARIEVNFPEGVGEMICIADGLVFSPPGHLLAAVPDYKGGWTITAIERELEF